LELNSGVGIHGQMISNLRFTDDIDLLDSSQKDLQQKAIKTDKEGREKRD